MVLCPTLNTSLAAAQEKLQSAGQSDCKEMRQGTCLQADLGLTVHKSDKASYPFFVTHQRKLLHTYQVACQSVYITASSLS